MDSISVSDVEDLDLPASILTQTQRRYFLTGGSVKEGTSAERALRHRIRRRVLAACYDIVILSEHLTDSDREDVIATIESNVDHDVINRCSAGLSEFETDLKWGDLPRYTTSFEQRVEAVVVRAVERAIDEEGSEHDG